MSVAAIVDYYKRTVLDHPRSVLVVITLIVAVFAVFAGRFRLDASADSLVLENDQALKYYREISAKFGNEDILILTYSPKQPLYSQPVLDDLKRFDKELGKLDHVASVMSILTVPLIESPLVTLDELSKGIRTLEDPKTDKTLARKELATGPIYKDLLVSHDEKTTALLITVKRDVLYHQLLDERNALRAKALKQPLSDYEQTQLEQVSKQYTQQSVRLAAEEARLIENIRDLMARHKPMAAMHLGGVTMITADSIEFVRNDLTTFSFGILAFIIVLMVVAFKKPRWVIVPMMTCLATSVIMIGLLGMVDWPVTVVSSNFISLVLIITLSLTIHLIVRYRELQREAPEMDAQTLILETVRLKFVPSFYTVFTTIVAFFSLISSDIRPIIDFGWMMCIGVAVAFVMSFVMFPAILALLPPPEPVKAGNLVDRMSYALAVKVERYHWVLLALFALVVVGSIYGISRLSVENRFIDYYKDTTEIYQGMELIDKKLGGTTPLDVVITAPKSFYDELNAPVESDDLVAADEDAKGKKKDLEADEDDIFSEEWLDEQDSDEITATSYWFNTYQLKQVAKIHDYLDSLPETGKVLSVESTMAMLRKINPQVADDSFLLAVLYKSLPEDIKQTLFAPYMTVDGNELRFSIRLYESDRSLRRNELVNKIRHHLVDEMGLEPGQVHLTGMAVLYNNMLQSLFRSQIMTIGVVFVAILLMFIVLFRSLKIALITIIPNIVSAAAILGIMGWLNIPLDLMTITIAAISIGIAVDDSIHYMHRFIDENKQRKNYWESVKACHGTIGQAIYFTSVTITLGFGLLVLSAFIPTIYFGLLTGLAMVVALFANLTLLPILICKFKATG